MGALRFSIKFNIHREFDVARREMQTGGMTAALIRRDSDVCCYGARSDRCRTGWMVRVQDQFNVIRTRSRSLQQPEAVRVASPRLACDVPPVLTCQY